MKQNRAMEGQVGSTHIKGRINSQSLHKYQVAVAMHAGGS